MISTSEAKDLEMWLEQRADFEQKVYQHHLKRNLHRTAAEALGKKRAFVEVLAWFRFLRGVPDNAADNGGE